MKENIKNICVKYLMNEANIEELDILEDWLKNPRNNLLFTNYVKVNYAMDINMNIFDNDIAKKEFLEKIRQDKRIYKKRKSLRVMRYTAAAVLVGVLATTYFFRDNIFNTPIETIPTLVNSNTNSIEPGTDKATLTLGDGSVVILEKGNTFQTQNASSNGEDIIYEADKSQTPEISYNYLTIPRGGQFYVVLADGTKVWLNSESQLKYPVSFIEGETRKVELVYGEAYFDVSPSVKNQGSKFKVLNQSQEIEVLGTEFNIKAYKDEEDIVTTLVEGKVTINTSGEIKTLKPSEQSLLNVNTQKITVNKVDNLLDAIAWKDDYFSFQQKSMKDIMKVLSRWYDVDYIFKNPEKEKKTFTGILDREDTIQELLLNIQKTNEMIFTIDEKTVIIE